MKIVVTANGADLDAPASPVFGRCPAYVFVDTETMQFEAVENPAIAAPSGAGIQAAQFVVERGAQAIVTGNVGPNAFGVFQASGVPVCLFGGGTVREAVEAYKVGRLQPVGGANVLAHSGMGRGMGARMGRGMGMGRGGGIGRGMGLGGGRGRGRSMGIGRRTWDATPLPSEELPPTPGASTPAPDREKIASLQETADELREQLSRVRERLEELEAED